MVFDCDGLLLDTEACWSRAEAKLFAGYGFPFGPEQKDLLIGRTLEAACSNMADYFGRPGHGAQLQVELVPLVEAELVQGVQPMPGAVDLVQALAGSVPLAVATNSPRTMLDVALGSAGLAPYLAVSVAADEVRTPKPHPELYLTAFELLGVSPNAGVALEDSSTGVAAARAAGAYLITVPSQPGKQLDGDFVTTTLADPEIVRWARDLSRKHPGS